MTAASTELTRQKGVASVEDLELAAENVQLDSFLLDAAARSKLQVSLVESITSGYVERTIEGASLISVTINDGTREILRSGMFGTTDNKKLPAIDVKVEGLWFRLSEFNKNGSELELVFEDRIVAYLRSHDKPIASSRGSMTRAQFIGKMVREVKKQNIRYYCPELHRKQPIEKQKPKKKSERERKSELAGGLLATTDIKIKKAAANKSQLEVCEEVLDTGVSAGANKKVLVSAIMAIIQESDAVNSPGTAGVDVGPFDQNIHDGWPADGNVPNMANAYFKAAIASDKANPNQALDALVQSVQHSGAGVSKYTPWRGEAEKIVEEYGSGAGHSINPGQKYFKEYEFHRGPPDGSEKENSWDCSFRLAQEVNWRRFVVGNTLYFVQDSDLMKRKPIAAFSEDSEGIEDISGNISSNMPTNECTVKARASRWWAPPGSVVKVENHGPYTGNWLVFKIRRDLFSPETTITLHQPEAAKPEKAPEEATVETSGNGEQSVIGGGIAQGGTPRERIVNAAKWGLENKDKFTYNQVRPMAKSLFEKKAWTTTDCSAFATLCYKAGGVKDPNGAGYNGSGNTDTLKANGNHTAKPEPGDLIFYSNPDHVAVYIGEGKVIELGGTPGPNEEPINYRTVVDQRNYSLESDTPLPATPSKGNHPPSKNAAEQGPEGPGGGPHLNGLEEQIP